MKVRVVAAAVFVMAVGVAIAIRLVRGGLENTDAFPQASGTALHASGMYAVVLFVAPLAIVDALLCWRHAEAPPARTADAAGGNEAATSTGNS